MDLALRPLFHNNHLDVSSFGKENRLSVLWKVYRRLPSKLNVKMQHLRIHNVLTIKAVATLESEQFVQSISQVKQGYDLRLDSKSTSLKFQSQSGDSEEMDERERSRRIKISKANKGNVPWNKGRKHSPETLQRIRERTKLAMQDPKVKMKLANLGHAQSDETKKKIGVGVKMGWERRRKLLRVQENCLLDWQNLIAEASRQGYTGEDELQWNSYDTLDRELEQEWLESIEERKLMPRTKGSKRAPKSLEQRRKISEAISAKWADPEYRERVVSALAKYHGIVPGAERKPRRKPRRETLSVTRKPEKKRATKDNYIRAENVNVGNTRTRRRATPSFKDPQADTKLEMIRKIREQRAAMETKKREATERAKLLTAQAERAAKALETMAMGSSVAQASLLQTRKLIAEANQWIESIESGQLVASESSNVLVSITNGSINPKDENEDTAPAGSVLDGGQINDADLLSSSKNEYVDLNFNNCTMKNVPNGKDIMSMTMVNERISGDTNLNDALQPLKLNGTTQMQGNLLIPNCPVKCKEEEIGVEMSLNVESSSTATTKTKKKWVCGRLVEVEDS